jgi:cytochrome P450 PksS
MNEGSRGELPDVPLVKLITRAFQQDPYPDLAAHRETGSAIAVENGGFRMWLVCGYQESRALLADPLTRRDVISNRDSLIGRTLVRPERKPHIPRALRVGMIDRDGTDHRRLRDVVSKYFTPAAVAALRPLVETMVEGLLAGLPTGEPVDIVSRFAHPAAAAVMTRMLGLPQTGKFDYPSWVDDMLSGEGVKEAQSGADRILRLTREIIESKRAQPGDDITTSLIQATADGMLAEIELESTVSLLLIAGMEPAATIASSLYTLLRHPAQLAALRADPRLLPGTVEEAIRFESPFRMLPPRYREQPHQVGGATIPAGEFILISSAAANRDPLRYDDPDRFDIHRDATGHLGFSHGVHRCLGAGLGKLEVTVALEALLSGFPEISLAVAAEEIRWRPGTFMRRLYSLPVVLRRR